MKEHHETCGCTHEHEGCACHHTHDHEHHTHEHHDHEHEHHIHEHYDHDHEHHTHKHHEHHDHHHEHKEHELKGNAAQKVYRLENLGCANCAAKMEKKINELEEVEDATIIFATKQLKVASDHQENLLPKLQEICASIEAEVLVKEQKESVKEVRRVQREQQAEENTYKKERLELRIAILFFAAGIVLRETQSMLSFMVFVFAYIILGGKIIVTACRNLIKGQIFDENFLMSIATLGAFLIGENAEAVGVMLFYRIGELFEHIAVERSRSQIMEAVDMRPEVVNRIGEDGCTIIPSEEAKVGDLLLVRPGDRIPLDGVIVEGTSRIDTSPVTGESVPVKAEPGSAVISGCVNESGMLKMKVEKILEDSMVTRILNSVENAAASKPKMDRFITKFARVYTPFVVALALGTAIIPSLITGDWNQWVYTAITFLVISCPCALVLSVPLAFFSGIGAGSKKGILFKGGIVLEALKKVNVVIMDKTGTITKGNFVVQRCVPLGVSEEKLLRLAAECELASTHPIAVSILEEAKNKGMNLTRPQQVEEISGKGIKALLGERTVLCGNRSLMEAYHVDLSGYKDEQYGTEVLVAENGVFIGYILIADSVKEEAVSAIQTLKKQKLQTVMLTGDAKASAEAVAKQTGIQHVYAQLLPEEKLQKLYEIREKNGTVMFVGDGINDAPVLAGADVGAAMGSGADAAIEAADVVFMTSSLEAISDAVKIAKNTATIAMENVVFALVVKGLVMVLGLFGFANMWLAVFADTGVAMLCVLNAIRILYKR